MNKSKYIVKVYRSLTSIIAQAIDESGAVVLGQRFVYQSGKKPLDQAAQFGEKFGSDLLKKNVEKIVFDRSGFRYHGKIKAFADGMRKSGLEF
ncbi:MAG: 50S ribosomal protein L18 [candidate division WS2 bacterium ADurb.Bin280]|uniref:50S ribosomal protein L18 n=1 Tax=candidate division WS2 bacterium ADurb.Bin280 TaxID=1852829 RepID=A0A1V5SEV9_9BACT|nr:MAG: 50S ribosomal protein L18 [candidate division WS2 bacterium ADurb.Bin280]